MIGRRGFLTATLLCGGAAATPAAACKSPRVKDQTAYAKAVDGLLAAWWGRDFAAFRKPFEAAEIDKPFDARPLFDAHYSDKGVRFRGEVMPAGAAVVVQVVTVKPYEHAVCADWAVSDLFLVKFYPGIETPVMELVSHIDTDVLAEPEWRRLPLAPKISLAG